MNRKFFLFVECVKYVMIWLIELFIGCVKFSCSDNRVKGINRRINVSSKIKVCL